MCPAHAGCQGSLLVWQRFVFDAKAVRESLAAEQELELRTPGYGMDEA